MFYLFILESIGTPELLMIGTVALIVFGPRKLPEMMRTIGRAVAEFRRSTDDFKRTWEKEVNFESNEFNIFEDSNLNTPINQPKLETSIGRTSNLNINNISAPEIREVTRDDFSISIPATAEVSKIVEVKTETNSADKRNWL